MYLIETIHSRGNTPIIQAAFNSGIHYSTAKTILFFHKKQYKNYTTYIVKDPNVKSSAETAIQATYR